MIGRWHGKPFHDVTNKQYIISFAVTEAPETYDETKDVEVDINVKEHKEKRSLNANAYFHLLVDRIAKKSGISAIEAKNIMLESYGTIDESIGKIMLRSDIPYLRLSEIHLRATAEYEIKDEVIMRTYIVVKPSHLYDTKEMADLIDGTVEEAEALGIETLTPTELERLKNAWKGAK